MPAGPTKPKGLLTTKPRKPDSSIVGTSFANDARFSPVCAIMRSLPLCTWPDEQRHARELQLDVAGDEIDDGGARAFVGHVHELDARHRIQELRCEMADGAAARSRIEDLPGLRLSRARSSCFTFRAGSDGCTTRPDGTSTMMPSAVKSFAVSYGILRIIAGLMTKLAATRPVV